MKQLNKLALTVCKILEILHWAAVVTMAAVLICSAVAVDWLSGILQQEVPAFGSSLSTYGFEAVVTDAAGTINMTTVRLFAVGALVILSLMAMTFRNCYLILQKSQNTTPFQQDNIRMLREIGIFAISVTIVGLAMSTLIRLVIGVDATETSVDLEGFVMGILILCLTQFFAHGAALETDVDGLL